MVGFIDLFLQTGERHDALLWTGLSGFLVLDSNRSNTVVFSLFGIHFFVCIINEKNQRRTRLTVVYQVSTSAAKSYVIASVLSIDFCAS